MIFNDAEIFILGCAAFLLLVMAFYILIVILGKFIASMAIRYYKRKKRYLTSWKPFKQKS